MKTRLGGIGDKQMKAMLTEEQKRIEIAEWKASGQSKKAFCKDRPYSIDSLSNWIQRYSEDGNRESSLVKLQSRIEMNHIYEIEYSGAVIKTDKYGLATALKTIRSISG